MNTLFLISDLQIPQHDPRAVSVALKLIEYIKPTEVAYIGDVISADAVSSFAKKSFKEAAMTLEKEVKATNRVLDQFDAVFDKLKIQKRMFLEGNHESRILNFILRNAVQFGDIEGLRLETLLKFKERKYTYYPVKQQPVAINKFNLIHGLYANQYHSAKTVLRLGRNVLYGHTHDFQVHCSHHSHNDAPKIAMSIGCLCKYDQSYISTPTNWCHGVGVVYYDDKGFTPYFLPIVKYRTIFDGRIFNA